jgi:2-oxoacid:acceptor oxidoreductase gamma subunit (pyruvate/2-ketoisovalerate family)
LVEVRIHGRGGQGAVAAAHVLALSLFREGKWVQAFPHFGVERRGAPVAAFVRFNTQPIELRCHIYTPDYVIILDPTLSDLPMAVEGVKPDGAVLVNSPGQPEDLDQLKAYRAATVDASSIALKHGLGSPASPIVNTAILGAFARFSEIVSCESVIESIKELIKRKTEQNIAALKESYDNLRVAGVSEKETPR